MSAVQRDQNQGNLSLAMTLGEALMAMDQRSRANRAAGAAAGDYESLYRNTTGNMDDINGLVQALIAQMQQAGNPMGELDEEAIRNREAQRFSALVPSVDRAAAMAGSQGYAQAIRSGMGDSTQAVDQAGALTRQFGDMYSKLQENARGTAFQEALERLKSMLADKTASTQQLGTAATAVANYGNNAQRIADSRMQATSRGRTAAEDAMGKVFNKLLDSKRVTDAAEGFIDKGLDKAGDWISSLGFGSQPSNPTTMQGGGMSMTPPAASFDIRSLVSGGANGGQSSPAPMMSPAPKFNTDYSNLLSGSSSPASQSSNYKSYEEPFAEWNSPSQSSWSDATEYDWTW